MKDDGVQQLLTKVYGTSAKPRGQKALMEKYADLPAGYSQPASRSWTRHLQPHLCAVSHPVHFGGKIGPDLTGSNRGDLNYLSKISSIPMPSSQ